MKPDISHDLVNDFTVKTTENNCTVASTSLSRPLKIWPKIDLSSAACSHRITPITMASCNKGNLTMLRIGARTSLIIRWVLLVGHHLFLPRQHAKGLTDAVPRLAKSEPYSFDSS